MSEETDSVSMIEPMTEPESQSILRQEVEDSNPASSEKEGTPESIEDSEVVDTETVSETILKESNETNKNAPVFNPKLTQLPLARIKHIMKMDPDVNMASQVIKKNFVAWPCIYSNFEISNYKYQIRLSNLVEFDFLVIIRSSLTFLRPNWTLSGPICGLKRSLSGQKYNF